MSNLNENIVQSASTGEITTDSDTTAIASHNPQAALDKQYQAFLGYLRK